MSNYTVNFRNMVNIFGYTREEIESWFSSYNLEDYLTTDQIQKITDANVWTKQKLASKIFDWYYMREIGLESPALFAHYAKAKMSRIMEKYLPIIYTKSLNYNILDNKNITETIGRMGSETGNNQTSTVNNSSSSASGLTINSDTPQRTNKQRKYPFRQLRNIYNRKRKHRFFE